MFTIGISRTSHLLLVCTGLPQFADLLALVDLAVTVVRRERFHQVLIDLTGTPPAFDADQRAELGAYAGRVLADCRVALVVANESRFAGVQSAATQRGGTLQSFANHGDATAWLESKTPTR